MARKDRQKRKLLALERIFWRETDQEHGLSMAEIIERLRGYEISAERKSLYTDFEELGRMGTLGLRIKKEKCGQSTVYKLVDRPFSLSEVKLLVDLIQSAKFITEEKSRSLISKVEKLVSDAEAGRIHRQVKVFGRVKTDNESIYDTVDALSEAICEDRPITFQYLHWNLQKEKVPKRKGAYLVSPWTLLWSNENYYLIAYDHTEKIIKHFRADKISGIQMQEPHRLGKTRYEDLNVAEYARKLFGMFSGEELQVTLRCKNELAGVFLDRFGVDTMLIPVAGEEQFEVTVPVFMSQQFLGWVIGLGEGAQIIAPDQAVEEMRKQVQWLSRVYQTEVKC